MQKFIFLGLFISSVSFAECPDYSGKYEWADEYRDTVIQMTIAQSSCDTMDITYVLNADVTVKDHHVFDGKEHLISEDSEFKAVEKATMSAAGIRILEERWLNPEDDGDPQHYFVDIEILKPSIDQVVIKRTTVSESGQREATDKTTYMRLP